ncbi:ferric reductase-like protein transmembrane component 4 [Epithele typhae]|uniref:ferric reductase-like protein transmembrane component 4 n=1 Tax=Epithele typhae TaxID=378194 RepID=UPI002007FBC5|nr:ferric reductase-like protein transmembrane component 4 [Epithele typhae]KAH9926607.1 ferric reductase-like protein transmembrane component 4 [Epithele typhae]
MQLGQLSLALAFVLSGVVARNGHGLVGYGIGDETYLPYCTFACRESISAAALNCSTLMDMDGMQMAETDPSCYATDNGFLQTLAFCISQRCSDLPVWRIEKWWGLSAVGSDEDQPAPKETYIQALDKVNGTPTAVYTGVETLNETYLVTDDLYSPNFNTDFTFWDNEEKQEGYGLAIFMSGVAIPVGFSLLRFLPFPAVWRVKFTAIFDSPLFGNKHDTPVFFGLVQVPKLGQALFIFYFIVINIIFNAVNYHYPGDDNTWYPGDKTHWISMQIANRLGLISFANMPLLFLYAGRNNVLLWITNWSHSTFLLLHRWIAAIATVEAILHSLVYLRVYVLLGEHAQKAAEPFWYWGAVATIGMSLLLPTSVLPLRQKLYELFLAWHVLVTILVVAGCYWHIVFEFAHQFGYEVWMFVCMAIWAFDRVARVARIAAFGLRTAQVTVIDDDYVRLTVPDVSAFGHAYLYFPTLTWRVWENHPFSVASATLLPAHAPPAKSADDVESEPGSLGKHSPTHASPAPGATFYVRTARGLTALLRSRATLPVLVEGGYASHSSLAADPRRAPTLVALAGGVGVTAVLPHVRAHPGRAVLHWGARTAALVDDVRRTVSLAGVETEVTVGARMDVRAILTSELVDFAKGEVCVLVCGPPGLADEVRTVFAEIVQSGVAINARLVVESFSW